MSKVSKKIPLVAVAGPTASGKTALGIALSKHFGGEIVSADSMQIYKGMTIAAAVPTEEERKTSPHHLIEFLEPSVKFSVADYVEIARKTILEIANRNKLPILVGGTGLYINSLVDGIEFTKEKPSEELRKKLEEEFQEKGGEEMLKKLSVFDPQTANRLNASDKRRILRAIEIFETTGITLTRQNELSKVKGSDYNTVMLGITFRDREKLYERINLRVDKMLDEGLLDEARQASNKGVTAAQAIGHKEFIPYFKGEVSLEEAVEKLKRETRRYAKRQLTWFRRDTRINWLYADEEDVVKKAIEIVERKI